MRKCLAPSGRVPFHPPTKSSTPCRQHENPCDSDRGCHDGKSTALAVEASEAICDPPSASAKEQPPKICPPQTLKRKPLQSLQLHPNKLLKENIPRKDADGSSQSGPCAYYSVLYTKRAPNKKKKNKTCQDGVLEARADGSVVLYDLEGKVASRAKVKGCLDMPEGAEVALGNWELEVQSELMEASFREQWMASPDNIVPVVVDPYICRHLRPHQREGVRFMYGCVTGQVEATRLGAILADEMGLGKTLQIVALIWTLLRQGPQGRPTIKRTIVVSPSSLTQNFAKEARRWLGDERMKVLVLQPGPAAAEQVHDFKHGSAWPLLAVSYETLRKYSETLAGACDLLICDEGHRLKSAGGNKTMDALVGLKCSRRIILTGTPMQNNMEEYYAMISFVCGDLLGPLSTFKRVFADPIARSNERDVSPDEAAVGLERSNELARRVAPFVLRRTAEINSAYLPPLTSYVVFCHITKIQEELYRKVLQTAAVTSLLGSTCQMSTVLPAISALRKICNHPDLLHVPPKEEQTLTEIQSVTQAVFPADYSRDGSPALSGKLACLSGLLASLIKGERDRVVVASQSTAALDVISSLCQGSGYRTARIDGTTDSGKRHDIVLAFNSGSVAEVCLLSTRAGGAGLNLIGANRLVLYDSDWNPAMDLQAMARIWRDGQQKACHVYRLLSTGTVEEKIYQRQLMKGELASSVNSSSGSSKAAFTRDELRELFTIKTATACDTRDLMLSCPHAEAWREDMSAKVEDAPLKAAIARGVVSFVHISKQTLPTDPLSAKEAGAALGAQEEARDGAQASENPSIGAAAEQEAVEMGNTGLKPIQGNPAIASTGVEDQAGHDLVPCDSVDCLELEFDD